MTSKIQFILIAILIITISCNEDISNRKIVNNTSFGANISIDTSIEKDYLKSITVRLFDKDDKTIATSNVKLYINNTLLKLTGGQQQRYYHNYSKLLYKTDSIPKSATYQIRIILEDSIKKEIASFTPLKKGDFKYSVIQDNLGDFKFKWQFLSKIETSELRLFKSYFNTENNTHKDSIITTKNTNSLNRSYTLDKVFLETSDSQITTYFSACLTLKKRGQLNTNLLSGSSIIANSSFCYNTNKIDSLYVKKHY